MDVLFDRLERDLPGRASVVAACPPEFLVVAIDLTVVVLPRGDALEPVDEQRRSVLRWATDEQVDVSGWIVRSSTSRPLSSEALGQLVNIKPITKGRRYILYPSCSSWRSVFRENSPPILGISAGELSIELA